MSIFQPVVTASVVLMSYLMALCPSENLQICTLKPGHPWHYHSNRSIHRLQLTVAICDLDTDFQETKTWIDEQESDFGATVLSFAP